MNKQALLRRAVVAAAVGGLTLAGLATAQPAAAADSHKGTLTSGTAVTAEIKTAKDTVSYSLPAEKGEHFTISTSSTTWDATGTGTARLYVPNATGTQYILYKSWPLLNGQTPFLDVIPEANGLWKFEIDPDNNTTGKTVFTYASDAWPTLASDTSNKPRPIMEPGLSYKLANKLPGQNVTGYFHAEKDNHLSLDISASGWGTGGSASAKVYDPKGNYYKNIVLGSTPTYWDFKADSTGYWKVVVDPNAAAVGGISLTVAYDLWKGQLDTNKPVTAKFTSPGQDAVFGLYGVAGDDTPIRISGVKWNTGGSAKLWLYPPDSLYPIDRCDLTGANQVCTFWPNSTGAWRLVLDPQGGTTGEATVTRLT